MRFEVTLDDGSILRASPRCIQMLLSSGWRLADPGQTEDLLKAVEAEARERSAALKSARHRLPAAVSAPAAAAPRGPVGAGPARSETTGDQQRHGQEHPGNQQNIEQVP